MSVTSAGCGCAGGASGAIAKEKSTQRRQEVVGGMHNIPLDKYQQGSKILHLDQRT
jgi:hypothetical protein